MSENPFIRLDRSGSEKNDAIQSALLLSDALIALLKTEYLPRNIAMDGGVSLARMDWRVKAGA